MSKGIVLWDRSQNRGVKIIVSRDVTFNKAEMHCLKTKFALVSKKEQGK